MKVSPKIKIAACIIVLIILSFVGIRVEKSRWRYNGASRTEEQRFHSSLQVDPSASREKTNLMDIKYFIGIGDSITRAFLSTDRNSPTKVKSMEMLGNSFITGNGNGMMSVPRLLYGETPSEIVGLSSGTRRMRYYGKDIYTKTLERNFNVAMTGACSLSLDSQITELIKRWDAFVPNTSEKKKHKFISVLIGVNDLCAIATINSGKDIESLATMYVKNMENALKRLYEQFPTNTIVAVFDIWDITKIRKVIEDPKARAQCKSSTLFRMTICPSLYKSTGVERIRDFKEEISKKLSVLISEWMHPKYLKNGFIVKWIPDIFKKFDVELEFLSSQDCYHPSKIGQEMIAKIMHEECFLK